MRSAKTRRKFSKIIPVKKDLCSLTFGILRYRIIVIKIKILTFVPNSRPIANHFGTSLDLDQVRKSGPYWPYVVPRKMLKEKLLIIFHFSLICEWSVGDYFLQSNNIWSRQERAKVVKIGLVP